MKCELCKEDIYPKDQDNVILADGMYAHTWCWAEREREEEMGDDSDTHDWEPFAS